MMLPDPSTFIAEGASAAVYRLDGGRVLKLFHEGVDAGIIAREHAMAQAIQETGLPVPCVFGRAEAGGRQGIIYSEIEGPNLLHHIVRHPHRIGWAMGAMAALQRAIHTHDLPELRSRKAILAEDIEMAPIGDRLRAAAIDRTGGRWRSRTGGRERLFCAPPFCRTGCGGISPAAGRGSRRS
jgi:hypothetical protein